MSNLPLVTYSYKRKLAYKKLLTTYDYATFCTYRVSCLAIRKIIDRLKLNFRQR